MARRWPASGSRRRHRSASKSVRRPRCLLCNILRQAAPINDKLSPPWRVSSPRGAWSSRALRVIAHLEERGPVARRPHATDGSQVVPNATEEGAALLADECGRSLTADAGAVSVSAISTPPASPRGEPPGRCRVGRGRAVWGGGASVRGRARLCGGGRGPLRGVGLGAFGGGVVVEAVWGEVGDFLHVRVIVGQVVTVGSRLSGSSGDAPGWSRLARPLAERRSVKLTGRSVPPDLGWCGGRNGCAGRGSRHVMGRSGGGPRGRCARFR